MSITPAERVERHTPEGVTEEIQRRIEERVAWHAESGRPEDLERRLIELSQEWDVERALQANAASLMLSGLVLSLADRRFLLFSAIVGGFLLQHAVQGYCPPLPWLRRLGFRTQLEIQQERFALKALRGDFDIDPDLASKGRAVMEAVRS